MVLFNQDHGSGVDEFLANNQGGNTVAFDNTNTQIGGVGFDLLVELMIYGYMIPVLGIFIMMKMETNLWMMLLQ